MLTTKNRVAPALFSLLIFASFVAGCRPPGARALFEGRRLLEAGDVTNALTEFQIATSLLPTNATAWNYLGLASHRAGQITNAIGAYKKAYSLAPDLSEAHFNLGCLWLEQGGFDQARAEFTAYTLRRPSHAEGWIKLGTVALHLRDVAAAEKSFAEALRYSPKNPQALNGLGLVALSRNRPRDAAQHFAEAARSTPVYRPALLNLAITLQHQLKDRPQALQRYREYLGLTPKAADWDAVNKTAQTLELELSRVATPATNTQASVTAPPPARPVTNIPPHTLAQIPKTEPPTNAAKPVVAAKTSPPPAQNFVVTAPPPVHTTTVAEPAPVVVSPPAQQVAPSTVAMENQPQSVAVGPSSDSAPEALSSGPKKRSLLQRLNPLNLFKREPKPVAGPTPLPASKRSPQKPVEITVAAQPPPSTSTVTEPAVTKEPPKPIPRYAYHAVSKPVAGNRRDADRLFSQGVNAHKAAKWMEAISAYRAALQADPTHFEASFNLALAAEKAGNLTQSLAAYENALAILPDSVDARYNFALGLKRGGYFLDAAQELERILVQHPSDTKARLALANLYAQQLRQPDKARAEYNKLLEIDPRDPQADAIRHWLVQNPQ